MPQEVPDYAVAFKQIYRQYNLASVGVVKVPDFADPPRHPLHFITQHPFGATYAELTQHVLEP